MEATSIMMRRGNKRVVSLTGNERCSDGEKGSSRDHGGLQPNLLQVHPPMSAARAPARKRLEVKSCSMWLSYLRGGGVMEGGGK